MAQPGAVLPSSSSPPPEGPAGVPAVPPEPSNAITPARRRDSVLRKALPADPRMPIRLDRSAWRQLDPISQDETEALLVLDEITATPAGTDAASAATAAERAHAANPGIAVVAPTLSALSAPRDGTPVRSPAPALAKEVVEPRPQEQPTLPGPDPSVSVGMRVLMMMVALPWPALLAGLLGVTLMTVSATAAQREYQRELLHQQLSGIDALRDLAAPQRQLWQARLRAYRQLVSPLDPELLRWSARVQR